MQIKKSFKKNQKSCQKLLTTFFCCHIIEMKVKDSQTFLKGGKYAKY